MVKISNFTLIISIFALGFILYPKLAVRLNKNIKHISAEEAHKLIIENKELLVVDVRTPGEYKSGHIERAKSMPVGELSLRINELQRYKDKPLLVHCASGGRSPAAVRLLLKNGFTNVYHMKSGLSGWKYGLK